MDPFATLRMLKAATAKSKAHAKNLQSRELDPFAEVIESLADEFDKLWRQVQTLTDIVKPSKDDLVLGFDLAQITLKKSGSVLIESGSASVALKKDGTITIRGDDITIIGSGPVKIRSSSDVSITGSKIARN